MSVPVPAGYAALIASDRVSRETRDALLSRVAAETTEYEPRALSPAAYRTLRAVLARTLPSGIDLAQCLDQALAEGPGDGWRFADLPADAAAYGEALTRLEGFAELDAFDAEDLLRAIAGGGEGQSLQRWFQDLRGDAAKIYVAHPAILARIGYSGIAYGGEWPERQGFHAFAAGKPEAWQPTPERPA